MCYNMSIGLQGVNSVKNHAIMMKKPITSLFGQPAMMAKIPHTAVGNISFRFVPHEAAEWRLLCNILR